MAKNRITQPDESPKWRLNLFSLIPAVLALAGIASLGYPVVATWVNQYNQSKIISTYDQQVDSAEPEKSEQLAQAHRYNEALSMGAVLAANSNVPAGAGTSIDTSLDYDSILRANEYGLMGRIRIPAIKVDLPIYHGTADETLLQGIGHLEGTSLPVGGPGTRSVLTGHRGLAEATLFTHLDQMRIGDTFTLEIFGEVLAYRVVDHRVVEPDDTESLRAEQGRDLATLVTCTPLGINTHRILVTGERILPTPAEELETAGQSPKVPGFPWWAIYLPAAVLAVGVYIWQAGRPAKRLG